MEEKYYYVYNKMGEVLSVCHGADMLTTFIYGFASRYYNEILDIRIVEGKKTYGDRVTGLPIESN